MSKCITQKNILWLWHFNKVQGNCAHEQQQQQGYIHAVIGDVGMVHKYANSVCRSIHRTFRMPYIPSITNRSVILFICFLIFRLRTSSVCDNSAERKIKFIRYKTYYTVGGTNETGSAVERSGDHIRNKNSIRLENGKNTYKFLNILH